MIKPVTFTLLLDFISDIVLFISLIKKIIIKIFATNLNKLKDALGKNSESNISKQKVDTIVIVDSCFSVNFKQSPL